jgi:hypothetical protein
MSVNLVQDKKTGQGLLLAFIFRGIDEGETRARSACDLIYRGKSRLK